MTEKSASEKTAKSKADAGRDARAKDSPLASAVKSETTGSGSHSSAKKRRKVNHGELFVRARMRQGFVTLHSPRLRLRFTVE
jgi:hypothetical protein